MIICLTAGLVLSAPIKNSLDHSLERRSLVAWVTAWFQVQRENKRRRKENEAIQRFRENLRIGPSHVSSVPRGSSSSNPSAQPSLPVESEEQASSSAVSE
jgi:hypothetical protein